MRGPPYGGGVGAGLKRSLAVGVALLIAVAAITLGVLGSLSSTSSHDAQLDAGAPVPATPAHLGSRARHRTPAPPHASEGFARAPVTPAEVRLQTALGKAIKPAGPDIGVLVEDLSARTTLFVLHPKTKRPPASVEKLYTTAALMRKLGPNTRLHTDVLGRGHLAGGVWHGDLYLRGGGDPTFGDPTFNRVWESGRGPTAAQLAAQLVRRGIHRVTGHVYADESLFDRRRGGLMTAYAPDTPDFGGQLSALVYDHGSATRRLSPAQFAAKEMVLVMRGSGIAVTASKHTASSPRRAHVLASVSSPPMSVMTRLMDVPSDDLFAELFTKQLGVLFGAGGTISAGARVISRTIADTYGLHPTILDGSGLSRNDRSSPLEVVDLLAELWRTQVGRQLEAALPTVGVNGTVQSIGLKTAAQGHCVAKTGTLNYVSNLAGYCRSRSGHILAFAFMVDGPQNYVAIPLESRMIGAIARY